MCICLPLTGTEDFVPFEQDVFIASSFTMVQTLCQTVTILGDRLIENDEFFFVMVIPSNPLDFIDRNYSQITILDDDGMLSDTIKVTGYSCACRAKCIGK